MTNEQRLREIEARASAATPGPWQRDGGYILSKSETVGFLTVGPRDMAFIAAAREDIPFLLERLRAARKPLHYEALAQAVYDRLAAEGEMDMGGVDFEAPDDRLKARLAEVRAERVAIIAAALRDVVEGK